MHLPLLFEWPQLAMMEGRVFLSVLARSGLQIELAEPNEEWIEFPLLKPKRGMPLSVKKS